MPISERPTRIEFYMPQVGCALAVVMLLSMCVLPWFFLQAMQTALEKLHLGPVAIAGATVGIIFGGLVNLPLYEVQKAEPVILPRGWSPMQGWTPLRSPTFDRTIVAVNL